MIKPPKVAIVYFCGRFSQNLINTFLGTFFSKPHQHFFGNFFLKKVQMCWNAEVSFESFGLGIVGIILAIVMGMSPSMILFFASIVFMQFIEGIVWTYGRDPDINFYASLSAAGLLVLQPIASILAIAPAQYKIPMLLGYVVLGLISQVIERRSDPRSLREQYRMEEGEHLIWKWMEPIPWRSRVIYFMFLIGPLIITKQYDFIALVLLTLAVSVYSFGKGWGSMWCWIVDLMAMVIGGKALVKTIF